MNKNEVIKGLGFHHIALKVKDLDASIEFYKKLGMTEVATWGEGNDRIQMMDIGDGGIFEIFAGGGNESDNGKWLHYAFKVDDVEAAYNAAIAAGAKSHIAPKVVPLDSKPEKMTLKIAFVLGPDDEQLEFFSVI